VSEFIRTSFLSKEVGLLKSPSSVITLIQDYYSKMEQTYIEKFGALKRENKKISIYIDEWTSFRDRRYMNISCILQWTSLNLVLIRINGKCPA
jgi:hypothetical protein